MPLAASKPASSRSDAAADYTRTLRGQGIVPLAEWVQDFSLRFWFRCSKACNIGVAYGIEPDGAAQTAGFVRLSGVGPRLARVRFDRDGKIVTSDSALPGIASPNPFPNPLPPPKRFPPPAGHPITAEPQGAQIAFRDWNHVELRVNGAVAQLFINNRIVPIELQPAGSRPGKVALLVEADAHVLAEVRGVAVTDFVAAPVSREQRAGPGFHSQRLSTSYSGYGEAVADIDGDGNLDLVAAKTIYFGPEFLRKAEIEDTRPHDPGGYFPGLPLAALVDDFTGDGRPDILMSTWPSGGPIKLFVNPGQASMRWQSAVVLPTMDGEIFALADLDGDGRKSVVFAANGAINEAHPVEGNALGSWAITPLTETGPWGQRNAHGLGTGDVNGDGRIDLLSAWGWWEQPAQSSSQAWRFNPEAFGRSAFPGNPGGAQMHVYDVNADGLPDVLTALEGHGRGLAWFEQNRASDGSIRFDRHLIMDIDPAQSHGVAFSEIHSLALADIDGDGLADLVAGKSNTNVTHWNPFGYVDSDAAPVLYWFKLVRQAGGRIDYVPYLLSAQSGAGRQIQVADLDRDGRPEIFVNTRQGVFVFRNKLQRRGGNRPSRHEEAVRSE